MANQRFIVLPNGDIAFPHRGDPPSEPIGYVRDSGDPYLFHLNFDFECKFRRMNLSVLPCGKNSVTCWCDHYNSVVNPIYCNDCEVAQ